MKKAIIIISVLVVVVILGFVGYKFFVSAGVSQKFINKHNEIVSLEKEEGKLANLEDMPEISNWGEQIKNGDYDGALKSVETALGRKKEAYAKLDSVKAKLSELKSMIVEIADSKVKASADKFVDIDEKENSARTKYYDIQIQMLEKMKAMVSVLVRNKSSQTVSSADEKAINDLSKQIEDLKTRFTAAEKELNDVQVRYKETEKEFFQLAGLKIAE